MRVELATESLRSAAGGCEFIELEGNTIRKLLGELSERYPRFGELIEDGIAVAIDGQIYQDDWNTPIPRGAELVLIPYIKGG